MSDVVLGKKKPMEETTPEYEKLRHYIFELENHLSEALKHAHHLVKRHRGDDGILGFTLVPLVIVFSSYILFIWLFCFPLFIHPSGMIYALGDSYLLWFIQTRGSLSQILGKQ